MSRLQWEREAAASPGRFHLRLLLRRFFVESRGKVGYYSVPRDSRCLNITTTSLRNLCRRRRHAFARREGASAARYRAFSINAKQRRARSYLSN